MGILNQMNSASASDLLNGHGASGSLEDLKSTQRRSQNMTECVPVPSSEHVAEIVGRQGCKIKALRAKTNTYIKTPVRGEEPVFVVTGRKEDVSCAKREILSAAEHFSQIRASRKNNINSTLAFGQLVANTPGQTTIQVRVPYRVVGLVVGPKGATIKRIQQQTHTYIVTPSRDKEPVFEVTGLPENVETAKKEIEAHIELRTGGVLEGQENLSGDFNSAFTNGSRSGLGRGLGSNSFLTNNLNDLSLHSLLDSNNFNDNKFDNKFDSNFDLLLRNNREEGRTIGRSLWGCGDSHDSGIGHSPPYDSADSVSGPHGAIWNELGKVLGNMDSPTERHSPAILNAAISKPNPDRNVLNPRSAGIDLGIPMGNNINHGINEMSENQTNSLPFTLESLSASLNTLSVSQGFDNCDARQESLLASLALHRTNSPDQTDTLAFSSVDNKPPGLSRDFLSFSNH